MKIKRLGRTGLKVSEICLGTMTFGNQCDEPTSHAIMDKAFNHGVTFFDTADVYPLGATLETVGRTEEYIGRWLKDRREHIVLATKFFGKMGSGRSRLLHQPSLARAKQNNSINRCPPLISRLMRNYSRHAMISGISSTRAEQGYSTPLGRWRYKQIPRLHAASYSTTGIANPGASASDCIASG